MTTELVSAHKKLVDCLPPEFSRQFTDTRAWKMRDVRVVKEFDSREVSWPGNHKNVTYWWILENDYVVGFNENPSRGWSFPVVKIDPSWKDFLKKF